MPEYTRTQRTFRDISLSFVPHPLTGDITILTNERAINNALKNIIFTMVGERPFDSEYGSSIVDSVFDVNDPITSNDVLLEVERAIQLHEPRIELSELDVSPTPDSNHLEITIKYLIIGYDEIYTFKQLLTPTR